VVFLGPNEILRVVARWGPESGDYMMHCHNLIHEDNDMMVAFRSVGNRLVFDKMNRTFAGLDLPLDPDGINRPFIEPLSDRSQPFSNLTVVGLPFLEHTLQRNLYRTIYPPEQFFEGYPIDWTLPPYNSQSIFPPPFTNPYEVNYVELDTCPDFIDRHQPAPGQTSFYG